MKKSRKKKLVCDHCGKAKPDVYERPDPYSKDVNNDPDATHVSCDECNEERAADV